MIAALYVDPKGAYAGLPSVELWDKERDARRYAGPYPVVAHPPCGRWCKLAALVEARYGHKRGDDGGCFAAALAAVRAFGGVLEHPAFSAAWSAFDLPKPTGKGAWVRGICGGWSCEVDQSAYGHPARKSTWLYVFGTRALPSMRLSGQASAMVGRAWNPADPANRAARCSFLRNRDKRPSELRRLSSKEASATPPAFRDLLLEIARSCTPKRDERMLAT